jgi:ferric-dicitrate binding protein FerR (iron transport regulator)
LNFIGASVATVCKLFAFPAKTSDQAILWIARLRAADVSPGDRSRFAEWLSEPAHRCAFDAMLQWWIRLGCTVNLEIDAESR